MSVNIRWITKIVADWTAVINFRHPNEVGGLYFTIGIIVTVILGIVSSLLYDEVRGAWSQQTVAYLGMRSSMLAVASYVMVLATIKKGFWGTFWETTTSNKFLHDVFIKEGLKDEQVSLDEEREDKLIALVLGKKITPACTFVRDAPLPQPPS